MTRRTLLFGGALGISTLGGQEPTSEQRSLVDAAIPRRAPAKPRKHRRMLVSNLSMRDGRPVRGSSFAAIPTANYAFEQMGGRTGAYEPVFSNDLEMFRPEKIRQFDAL